VFLLTILLLLAVAILAAVLFVLLARRHSKQQCLGTSWRDGLRRQTSIRRSWARYGSHSWSCVGWWLSHRSVCENGAIDLFACKSNGKKFS